MEIAVPIPYTTAAVYTTSTTTTITTSNTHIPKQLHTPPATRPITNALSASPAVDRGKMCFPPLPRCDGIHNCSVTSGLPTLRGGVETQEEEEKEEGGEKDILPFTFIKFCI